ncbi:L1 capsid protein [Bos taurus papillomavirus 16]|uniref:Major capsid protein L1 n=1 Tax=Bos taurus papillomavirus 16 TaxID=1887214 RepID=A0A1B2K271_9PAPI|nr:L1 capsid protein [Bos taurus papillomavirus 16]ANZ90235.1 L1 capsid protein [Bos taurus papillomavirus 16]
MALWVPSGDKFYIPQTAVTRILNTEEYVKRTDQYYYATSNRLLTVGHPYWTIKYPSGKIKVPKVSSLQYRAFKVTLPDPNKFVFSDPNFYNPENQRLVWGLVAIEIDRGQPMGIGISGSPYINKLEDVENPGKPANQAGKKDNRVNMAWDPKQMQMIVVGCKPCYGEHWGHALKCADQEAEDDKCPAIELKFTEIEDGDMMDTGLGAMDFRTLQANLSNAPLDICQQTCKYPDFLRMSQDIYGDRMFFCVKTEQMYYRHFFSHDGVVQEEIPPEMKIPGEVDGTYNYSGSPSGSLVSSNNTIFNKPYYIRKAQGHNNGLLWNNVMFVTIGDTTRGTNLSISVKKEPGIDDDGDGVTYAPSHYYEFLRHTEEFELQVVLQACIVDLTPDTVAHLHQMDPTILDNWSLGVNTTNNDSILETYRYKDSIATRCPDKDKKTEPKDPYEGRAFWNLDFSEKLTQDLDYAPLGRKFLFTQGRPRLTAPRKRKANTAPPKNSKRRRKNVNNQ